MARGMKEEDVWYVFGGARAAVTVSGQWLLSEVAENDGCWSVSELPQSDTIPVIRSHDLG